MHDQMTTLTQPQIPCHGTTQSSARPPQTLQHPKGCTPVDPALIARVRAMVTYRTDAALTERFGISYNTWRKLIGGQPVRASLLTRLEERLSQLEAQG